MSPQQEAEYGRLWKALAEEEGHFPQAIKDANRHAPYSTKSKKRDYLRKFFQKNPGPFTVRELIEKTNMSHDTARNCCMEFVQEGWLSVTKRVDGYLFQVKALT